MLNCDIGVRQEDYFIVIIVCMILSDFDYLQSTHYNGLELFTNNSK